MPKVERFEAMEKELFDFPASGFVKRSVNEIREKMEHGGFKGVVLGASGHGGCRPLCRGHAREERSKDRSPADERSKGQGRVL